MNPNSIPSAKQDAAFISTPQNSSITGREQGKYMFLCFFFILFISPLTSGAGIVTTLPPLAGLVLMLDADAEIACLLPPGADAHDFQLTPRQVQTLKKADLLVRSSYDDGHWSGIRLTGRSLDLWPQSSHAWLRPSAVRDILPALAEALSLAAPERRAQITKTLAQALADSKAVEHAWRKALAPYRRTGVIMQHNAWQALMDNYKVPVWSVLESHHHGDNIRPHRLEAALAQLRSHPEALLWGNQQHANRGLQWLQQHAANKSSAALLLFDPLGDCGSTWVQLMHNNLSILSSHTGSKP